MARPNGGRQPGQQGRCRRRRARPARSRASGGCCCASGGGGSGSGSGGASNRFVGIDRPNADPTRRSGPQGTALNLAGLFGGGQPAVNPNVPAAAAQPVSAVRGPLAQGGLSKAPWGMGPLQPGMVWPKDMGPFKPRSSSGYGDPRVWG